ncbi:MAG: hemagglutinin repeat-containing protein [Burkholderiaceae bacterium]|nr:hemagglutinin repeat-containing protein [Burkholderiaceae bacterium]
MNKHLHRIVFNKTRGTMMVVAENVSVQGQGDTAVPCIIKLAIKQISLQMKPISFAAKLTAGVITCIMPLAYAQIVTDPNAPSNQRPTIVQTANGLPQVNIQAPSAAGVSRNTYNQFDVQSNGAILNNSRDNVQTQTGGWVQGNPWLAGGAARVILNEVNSSNPSHLRGYVEVAGQRAEVIIANPAGIQINGGGFINADRVTLTTGTTVNNPGNKGALERYRITQGLISVEGLGLDTRGASYTDILARSVQVNAGIWANKLKVVTGANEISINSANEAGKVAQGITPIASTGTVPPFSLDVAALGGMYAGHIYLIGTENGMGVRNQGSIHANGGNLVLLSNGFLTNEGAIRAAGENGNGGKLYIETAGNISNSGSQALIHAQDQADLIAGSLNNAGQLAAGNTLAIQTNYIDNVATGEIVANITALTAANNISNRGLIDGSKTVLRAMQIDNIGTGRIYGDQIAIAADTLNNDSETRDERRADAVIAARQRLDLGVGTLNNRDGSLLFSAGTDATAFNIGGSLDAQAQATGKANKISNQAATIESMGGLTISAAQLYNLNPDFKTRTDTRNESVSEHYIRLGGTKYLASELGRCFKCASNRFDNGDPNLPRLEYVKPSSTYPFEAGYSRVPYQLVGPKTIQDPNGDSITIEAPYEYPRDSPVWKLFAVTVDDHTTLLKRLESYNRDLISRGYRDFDHIWVTNKQIIETVVDNPGTPGNIVADGNMTLTGGDILNDNSRILAGGDLDISGGKLTNTETLGSREITDYGTFRRDTVEYSPYRLRAGYFGSGSYVEVVESVTTKLDTSVAQGNTKVSGGSGQVIGPRPPPSNSLVILNPDPNDSHIYKGDPRFNNKQQWLSSDYMLQVLATDPNTIQKRLGDGFYEQMLIREQVAELTGRRFLDGYASDEAQYQALMQAGAAYAKQWELVPGVSLSPEQMAKLTSDIVWLVAQEVVLPDGTITTALVPKVYVMPRPGDLSTGGSLLAGQNVNIQLTGDLKNSGTIAGRNVMQINADNVQNLGEIAGKTVSVAAQQDLINLGGRIVAEDSLTASAGRDFVVESTTSSATSSAGRSSSSLTQIDRVAGLYVTGDKGILVASAGNDFSVLAGVLSSKGDIQATAGNDVKLSTVETSFKSDLTANDRNYMRASGTEDVGSQIAAGGKISVTAGNNFSATAASVNAKEDLSIKAAGYIQVAEGRVTSQSDDARYAKSKGFLSSSSTESREQSLSDTAIGSNFGGKNVTLSSGGDTLIRGSTVIGDKDTTIVAGKDLNIEAATNTSQSSSFYESKKSGLFSGGGLSITLGKQQLNIDKDRKSTTASASTVGSIDGDVKLVAGKTYSQVGSNVLAPTGDIRIVAEKVDIVAAINTDTNTTEQRYKQSGLTLAVSSPIISAIQTAQQMSEAASQTADGRMQALAGATSALAAKGAYDAIQKGQGTTIGGKPNQVAIKDSNGNPSSRDATAAEQAGGVNISISIGSSSSQSKTTQNSTQVASSNVSAGKDVIIVASGAGTNSDVTVQGSDIRGGGNVVIAAEDQINLLAGKNTNEQHSTNKSSSGSVGISIGTAGFGVTASANSGRGNADGSDVSWTNTHVDAANQVVLASGGDANLIGAVVSGKQVVANIDGNLNIESLQDTSKYDSKQKDIGGSITIGAGGGGSLSYSKSSINSDYASVNEQSGIKAGDGGFQVVVNGNTDLKGGIIASTEQAVQSDKNLLATASLTTSDIQNKAEYKASAMGVTVGSGGSGGVPNLSGAGIGSDAGHSASTTQAGVSGIAGNKDVRTGDAETGIAKIFDADKVQKEINAQVKITQAFGQQASKAVNEYVQSERQALREQLKAKDADKVAIEEKLNDLLMQERVMNVLIGAVSGMGASALTKETLSAAANEMREIMIEDSKKFPGVTDGDTTLSNLLKGRSDGVRGDNVGTGGTRVDLDQVCGPSNERCATNPDGSLDISSGAVRWIGKNEDGSPMTLATFLESDEGKDMRGITGGIQGMKGTLFGVPYAAGSWQDKLIEAFGGPHDFIGGKLGGLYDAQGNATRGRSEAIKILQEVWSGAAIAPSAPFAMAELLPPQVWQAVALILGSAK